VITLGDSIKGDVVAPVDLAEDLLAVTPTCHYIEYLDVAAPVLAEPLRPVDGMIEARARPGIGLAWNEDAVQRYRVR
jgi:mandelate racemase